MKELKSRAIAYIKQLRHQALDVSFVRNLELKVHFKADICSLQSQSLTWQFACHLLLAVQFDKCLSPGKRQAVSQGSSPLLSIAYVYFMFYCDVSSTCFFSLSPTNSCFMNSPTASFVHCSPVSLVKALSLQFFSLSVCVSLPSSNPPTTTLSLPRCHSVHMAPACDIEPSQNTPDARFSPPLFPTLLNFKQNKRKGRERRRGGHRRRNK